MAGWPKFEGLNRLIYVYYKESFIIFCHDMFFLCVHEWFEGNKTDTRDVKVTIVWVTGSEINRNKGTFVFNLMDVSSAKA